MTLVNPQKETSTKDFKLIAVLRFAVWILLMPSTLFIAAGRFDWWMGWCYFIVLMGVTIGGRILAIRRFPTLLEERATALDRPDTKHWDKLLVPLLVLLGPFLQALIAGLDMRFDWSPPFALWLEILALILTTVAYLFASWPMLINPFFSSGVRIQNDRGQYVVSDGPYAIVRHPSYIGGIVGMLAASFALASLWSLLPVTASVIGLVIRTKLEDDTLKRELAGYQAYTEKTRYRLIPYVW